jgi:hypothetical protein
VSPPIAVRVAPTGSFWVEASLTPFNSLEILGFGVSGNDFRLFRRPQSGAGYLNQRSIPVFTDSFSPGQVLLYYIESWSGGQMVARSNSDIVVTYPFIDDPILPSTPIKAAHVSELVAATNLLRAAAGLPAISIGDARAGDPIRASHVQLLRQAINEGRTAMGASAFAFTTTPAVGGLIQIKDIQDLRDALH